MGAGAWQRVGSGAAKRRGEAGVMNPDRACPHEAFSAAVTVNRLQRSDDGPTIIGYAAEVRVRCAQCQEPFRFTGCQVGLSPAHPMVSLDETELRAPIRPASADPDFGMGIPGFAVRVRSELEDES